MDERSSVIIVDDDEILLKMLKEALFLQGYQCEAAANFESALKLINNMPFDIMITDIRMPDIDGFEITYEAKKIKPDMAVIIMTAYIDEFNYDNAIKAGASDFIKKPFTLNEFMARIQHVKLQEQIRIMAVTDELTGLCNRRGFFNLAEHALNLANRLQRQIFILYLDLDNLKEINDTLGHMEGDTMLIETANILRATYRKSDIIARIGGDEFAVIPVDTTEENAKVAASRLQKNIDTHNEKISRDYKLSISVGISYYDPNFPTSIDKLLSQADKSMYERKRNKKLS